MMTREKGIVVIYGAIPFQVGRTVDLGTAEIGTGEVGTGHGAAF
jgi:hypothetical protein